LKVLLISPYSPLANHDHAANDLALPLVKALAPLMELHVYAPGQNFGNRSYWENEGITFHSGTRFRSRQSDRLDTYPYSFRGSWSRYSTQETIALVNKIQPEILHAEYVQAAEPLFSCAINTKTSVTLHDATVVLPKSTGFSPIHPRELLRKLENAKIKRTMSKVLNDVDLLFVRSDREKQRVLNASGNVEVATVGLESPNYGWIGDRLNTASFGGALWRVENELIAVYLAQTIMPLVRQRIPSAELRIFGARPTTAVRELERLHGVNIIGEVDDYEEEFRRSSVTLAPSLVDVGLLMKAIRAMSVGAPIVLNTASAEPIAGLIPGVHALVADGPDEYAAHVVKLMQDKENARELGANARNLVRQNFNWKQTANDYHRSFERLLFP
jgi:glycosyltransferase involved in cell wall biosynthesis